MTNEILRTHAPTVSSAIARDGHADLATQSLAAAEGVYRRVMQVQAKGDAIVAIIAETVYNAAARERADYPRREALAVQAALRGADGLIRDILARQIEKARPL